MLNPSELADTTVFSFDGDVRAIARGVASEVAVQVAYGTVPYAVMMATPADLEDFAIGFSLSEGVIGDRADVRAVTVAAVEGGVRLDVALTPGRLHGVLARKRTMAGRTGCGVCGVEALDDLPRATERTRAGGMVRLGAVRRALEALPGRQVLHAATRAMHAAAWADDEGALVYVREDVGRHNALDKLIGALLGRGVDPASGFVVVTSRCSYEMVEKAAAFGAGTLVAISAPTTLGVARARAHGMTLLGVARGDGVTAFSGAERVVAGATAAV
jgi:FdhD protein